MELTVLTIESHRTSVIPRVSSIMFNETIPQANVLSKLQILCATRKRVLVMH